MVEIIFRSPTVAEVNGELISAPPPFPIGDCRGCALIGIVCEDDYDYPCARIMDDEIWKRILEEATNYLVLARETDVVLKEYLMPAIKLIS
ncbi:hypothetical protein [Thermofilum sp.]|jgi:hypothetical protein|uniref:hypothetical protein n=1 Tax=Thermofilum sp. TaxID=1961369 RepID=UPI0025875CEC|nr:hypothetical protein [Thermofilum sp.]